MIIVAQNSNSGPTAATNPSPLATTESVCECSGSSPGLSTRVHWPPGLSLGAGAGARLTGARVCAARADGEFEGRADDVLGEHAATQTPIARVRTLLSSRPISSSSTRDRWAQLRASDPRRILPPESSSPRTAGRHPLAARPRRSVSGTRGPAAERSLRGWTLDPLRRGVAQLGRRHRSAPLGGTVRR